MICESSPSCEDASNDIIPRVESVKGSLLISSQQPIKSDSQSNSLTVTSEGALLNSERMLLPSKYV